MLKRMLIILNFIFLLFLKVNSADKTYPAYEARDTLLKDILNNYHPSVRPAHANETVMLFVNIEIQHFDFSENTGAFHLVGLMHVQWRDPKLVWNPQSYGNTSHILVSQNSIWIPDLEFYNNSPDKFVRMNRNGFVSVKSNGVVYWSDYIEVNVFCSADMKNWPHDKHECSINFGSWTFDGFEVDIMHLKPNSSMNFRSIDMKNMEYKPYVTMDYEITFERQSSFAIIFRIPALTIILFTLLALRMDPSRKEKLWLNGLSLLIITGQLLYFARNIGHFHGTPNIVIFFSICFVLVTFAQVLAVFSLFVTHSKLKGYLPQFIEIILNSSFSWYLVRIEAQANEREETNEQFQQVKLDDTSNLIDQNLLRNDWLRLAKLFNILTFFAFCFIFLVTTSTLMI